MHFYTLLLNSQTLNRLPMKDYFQEMGIRLTDMHIKRQVGKLKRAVFGDDYEEFDDDSYRGEVSEEVLQILEKNISDQEQLSETEFLNLITKCSVDLVEWMKSQVKGVDMRLMTLYCFDFTNQTIGTLYDIEGDGDIDGDNPMFS